MRRQVDFLLTRGEEKTTLEPREEILMSHTAEMAEVNRRFDDISELIQTAKDKNATEQVMALIVAVEQLAGATRDLATKDARKSL